ncbi:class I SAM-dependent methyltransferase [Hamadaea tsunoensis]|uniref:class I SAM-dependent methyltransferase n=1 Tax=Hamadaea tsunoensis TaxID=53368 RepID=UPI00040226AA|nr:class I SAM-dependent methyltransferase [Hamadaea tsunoensis]
MRPQDPPANETPTERQRRVWDRMAPVYDRQIAFFERIQFGGGREWVCSRATGDVLEVAVGTGRDLPFYPPGVRVTGIDLSPEMLLIAQRLSAELGIDADLREGDAEALPFPDASFDSVVCVLALCSIPDPRQAIAEMVRVLRPDGRLLLFDHIGSHWWPVWAAQRLVEVATARSGEYMTRRQLPLLAPAGLRVVESERLKLGTVERIHAVKQAAHAAGEEDQ